MNDARLLPRYPVYIPTKGRFDKSLTAKRLLRDRVPFYLVVEPQEYNSYYAQFGNEPLATILTLPFSNLGKGSIPARNWIKQHSTENGDKRHWQLDDNLTKFYRVYKGKRIYCEAGIALRVTEDFVDRYTNVAISGLNYDFFGLNKTKPYLLNVHVYSCTLVLNEITNEWRGRYNEDTDMCLQVLADGWCTVQMNAFLVHKVRTMTMKGGNSDELYKDDGRLKMARSLERQWKGVVKTGRRFQRPQHVVHKGWRNFDTPLIRRTDIDFDKLENNYNIKLKQVAKKVKSKTLQEWVNNDDTK